MAHVVCAISGIDYKCDHFPLYLNGREQSHPIFTLSSNELLKYADRWSSGDLTRIDSYLLYLALFNSTELVDFRTPASYSKFTDSIVAQNMHHLLDVVSDIAQITPERAKTVLNLPRFAITPDTRNLTNSKYWIEVWEANIKDYAAGYKSQTHWEKRTRSEIILERFIKDKTKDISQYSRQLANWAYIAGEFDIHADYIVLDENDNHIRMADYWKRIIIACAEGDRIFYIPDIDLQDLIEHCEEYIAYDGIFTHTLMTLLREGMERKKSYFDIGDIDISERGTVFRILDPETSIEDANKLALIDSAPLAEPIQRDYPNKVSYLKARLKWQMAQDHAASNALREEINAAATINASTAEKNIQELRKITAGDL